MKRRVLAGFMVAAMAMGLAACGSSSTQDTAAADTTAEAEETTDSADTADDAAVDTSKGGLKIGCAIQTLSNQVWAQEMEAMEKDAKADGNELTVVDCDENANTQIDQIENFITSGMDAIVVNPVDPDAIEEVCKQARDAGILVFSWDEEMENSDINWLIENYDLGAEIGTQAAEWINDKFDDGKCEVVVLGYPQTPILLQRENGIIDKLNELAPNAEIVANQPAIDTTEGLNAMETILQAHPDVKVVCCIGGGGAAGANEALKGFYGDTIPEDVGIFSTDLTDETIASMQNGEYNKMCVAITGNAYVCGDVAYDLVVRKASGEEMDKNIYRDLIPVTIDNLDEMIAQ
ncbi:sugar ABC transporter substrate-binding protein [Clostridiaceae bacterium Marseille-Q4145]|jgi:ribose transport system substrate-binding protein|nr:sugar ABC transporter substrate-binding protein [Clostridiaceae bacterium Marseille-Q4145]